MLLNFFVWRSIASWFDFVQRLYLSNRLPLLKRRPNINIISKATLTLRMQIPVSLRNIIWVDLGLRCNVNSIVVPAWNINRPIDNCVCDMDALRSELLCQRSCQGLLCMARRSEGRHTSISLHRCCSTSEDERRRVLG